LCDRLAVAGLVSNEAKRGIARCARITSCASDER
jgi:hypothetical protein